MARCGSTLGTVVRWDENRHTGLIESPDLPGPCWVEAAVIDSGGSLRAGQTVQVDWTEPGTDDAPLRATRVVPREDLQTGLGG
jgi:cold shock CspA family protein